MAISKEKKKEIVERVKDIVSSSPSVVFATFRGLSATDTNKMRSDMRKGGVGYFVAKKTLVHRALAESKVSGDVPETPGELALVYPDLTDLPAQAGGAEESEDITVAPRVFYGFHEEYPENLSIVGGIFEGAYMSQGAMTEIAQIPSMDTLRAQFVNLIHSPLQQFAIVLNQVAEKQGE